MKYIAIFLLFVNAAYFVWLNFGAEELRFGGSPQARPLLNNGMVLLSEYQAQLDSEGLLSGVENRMCLSVTGFADIEDARALASDAQQLDLRTSIQVLEVPDAPQYSVFLPPASSRAMATLNLDALNELATSAGIELEAYLITRGPIENAVSLGVFSTLEAAEEVQANLAEANYVLEIQELIPTIEAIGVQLSGSESVTLATQAWDRLAQTWTTLQAVENVCETIAQGRQFP